MIFTETATKSENKYEKHNPPLKNVALMHFTVQNSRFVFKAYLDKNIIGEYKWGEIYLERVLTD